MLLHLYTQIFFPNYFRYFFIFLITKYFYILWACSYYQPTTCYKPVTTMFIPLFSIKTETFATFQFCKPTLINCQKALFLYRQASHRKRPVISNDLHHSTILRAFFREAEVPVSKPVGCISSNKAS